METQKKIDEAVRVNQLLGVLFIGTVLIMVGVGLTLGKPTGPSNELIAVCIGFVGIVDLVLGEFLAPLMSRAKKPVTLENWLGVRQQEAILGAVFRESVGVMGLVVYILNSNDIAIAGILWALSLFFLVIRFPTRGRFLSGIPSELLR